MSRARVVSASYIACVRLVASSALALLVCISESQAAILPDGRSVTPVGFTIPVENFASSEALSPDKTLLAVLTQDDGANAAIEIITVGEHTMMSSRLSVPFATAMVWTSDGLYVSRGYSGNISR